MKGWGLSAVLIRLFGDFEIGERDLLVVIKQEFLFQHLPKELVRSTPLHSRASSAGDPLAAHFTREMDRLWKGAELGMTERLLRKLQENGRRCGSGMQCRWSEPWWCGGFEGFAACWVAYEELWE